MRSFILLIAGTILLGVTFFSTAYAAPKKLTTYNQLLEAVNHGENVQAIIHINQCTPKDGLATQANEDTTTRLNFTIFSHYTVSDQQQEKFTIATSLTILTEHRTYGPVYSYARLRVFEDNSAEYHTAYYDPRTYELKSETDYNCRIGGGQSSIALYESH